jgi:hypothetical protein
MRKPASLKIAILEGLVNIGSRAARFNFMTLKVGILGSVYDELNKIVKNDGADAATTDAESYFLTRREAVGWKQRRPLNEEGLLLPLRRGSYIRVNIVVTLKRHACYL